MVSSHSHLKGRIAVGVVVSLVLAVLLLGATVNSAPAEPPPEPMALPQFDWPWAEGFHQAGANGIIHTMAIDSKGNLYVGGEFTVIGETVANRIARWDGTGWHALGAGVNGTVYALAIDSQDKVYVGGTFSSAGSCSSGCNRIAAWDGGTWSALGSGMDAVPNGGVRALALHSDGTLYAGGDFASAGTCLADCIAIARWNGTTWSALNKGISGTVHALALDNSGKLYAAGAFFGFEGCTSDCINIAGWNGTAWSGLETGLIGPIVTSLVIDANNQLYAGGDFFTAGSCTEGCEQIAKWNGSSWSGIGFAKPLGTKVLEMVLFLGTNLFVSVRGDDGLPYVRSWVGNTWTDQTANTPDGSIYALLIAGTTLYAGGDFGTAGACEVGCANLAQLRNQVWSPVGQSGVGPEFAQSLAVDAKGDVYLGGVFTKIGDCSTCKNIARWDGKAWHPLGDGLVFIPKQIAFDDTGAMYAIADFMKLWKWNGTAWSELGSEINGIVNALVIDGNNNVYIGGDFTIPGCFDCKNIAKWSGTEWVALDWGIETGVVRALAVDSRNLLLVGGDFTGIVGEQSDCLECVYLATWNGSTWGSLPNDINARVRTILIDKQDRLYIGGDFSIAGTCITNCKYLAQWNGSAWLGVGGGTNGAVYSLFQTSNGKLYAGGDFSSAGTCIEGCTHIAAWDGSAWTDLDNGMDSTVTGIAVDQKGAILAVGKFKRAGDVASNWFAIQSVNRTFMPLLLK